jgi:hypothetical protein
MNETYKVQDGCHNCVHVFEEYDYDSPICLFCTRQAPERPICGSVCLGEEFSQARGEKVEKDASKASYEWCSDDDPFVKAHKKWDEWSKDRGVSHAGICEAHCTKEKK